MYNIAFEPDKAIEINAKVSENIAPHLFVFCNYNPDSIRVFGRDAKFMLSVMNMYKLLVDASICTKLFQIAKENYIKFDNKTIKEITNNIEMLRTVLGHNLDERNGNDNKKKEAEKWFRSLIKKDMPDTENDYKILLDEIEKYGDAICDILSYIVKEMAKNNRKANIIESWEQAIIQFYQKPNSVNIIIGQLNLAYQARHYPSVNKILQSDVAAWVKDRVCYPEEVHNKNYNDFLHKKGISQTNIAQLVAKIEENNASLLEKRKLVARSVQKDVDKISVNDYLYYYAKEMAKKIEVKIKKEKVSSLLPQDIVQEIIEEEFEV